MSAKVTAICPRRCTPAFLFALLAGTSTPALPSTAAAQPLVRAPADTVSAAPRDAALNQFDIPAQPLSSALATFARQAIVQTLFAVDAFDPARSHPLRGAFTRATRCADSWTAPAAPRR